MNYYILFIFVGLIYSQTPGTLNYIKRKTDGNTYQEAFKKFNKMKSESEFSALKWKNIGPTVMGGRVTDIAVPKSSYFTFYVATAAGGVWKTKNNGTSWEAIFDNYSSSSIGDIAVSQSNSNILWVGTGENNSLRSSYAGSGVFKSVDEGKSFTSMGLENSNHIGRIIIHPENPDIVYVAVIGHLYTKNKERGLFKTENGGKTWEKILFFNDSTGVIDVSFAPNNPDIIYAASWERSRKAWNFVESGHGSGIHISKDSGNSWVKAKNGLPNGNYVGRIGFATTLSNPSAIFAVVDNQSKHKKASNKDKDRVKWATGNSADSVLIGIEVYKSSNYGKDWKLISKNLNNSKMYSTYGYFFGNMAVSPVNEQQIYTLGIYAARSDDGGSSWKYITENKDVHADFHAVWINPLDDKHIIIGNDGGIDISYDAGESWQAIQNLPIAQFYTIEVDMETPYNVYGGLQDNGTYKGSSYLSKRNSNIMGIGNQKSWEYLSGGDGFYVQVDKLDPTIYFSESQWGYLYRTIGNDRKMIRPKPKQKSEKYRFNWSSPIVLSKHNRETIYFGGNKLFKSLNRGDTWQEISPDLSKQDPDRKGDVTFGTITSISESELNPNLLYAGTDDGNLWLSKNSGFHWEKINSGLPEKWVSRVLASRHKESKVYVSFTGYRDDDKSTYLFVSNNYGKTWNKITNEIPIEPINVVREDQKNSRILYIGTDFGVYISINSGKGWKSLSANLPTVPVHDIIQHPRDMDLLIATHGRSIYKLNADIISQYSDTLYDNDVHIFDIKDITWSYGMYNNFYFTLNDESKVKIEILNDKSKLIKEYPVVNLKKGYHEIYWDGLKNNSKNRWDVSKAGNYIFSITLNRKKHEKSFKIIK